MSDKIYLLLFGGKRTLTYCLKHIVKVIQELDVYQHKLTTLLSDIDIVNLSPSIQSAPYPNAFLRT